jgi:putative SOS response-associated peptidase YedK
MAYMCGRYSITVDKKTIERRFNARFSTAQKEFVPTYNAAPSQLLPIITTFAPNEITLAKWGFVPEEGLPGRLRSQNNARYSPKTGVKPMFESSFSGRHCLVLTDGFYEWKTDETGKNPYRFVMKSGEPFTMAGIYARSKDARPRLRYSPQKPTKLWHQYTTGCLSSCRLATKRVGSLEAVSPSSINSLRNSCAHIQSRRR